MVFVNYLQQLSVDNYAILLSLGRLSTQPNKTKNAKTSKEKYNQLARECNKTSLNLKSQRFFKSV